MPGVCVRYSSVIIVPLVPVEMLKKKSYGKVLTYLLKFHSPCIPQSNASDNQPCLDNLQDNKVSIYPHLYKQLLVMKTIHSLDRLQADI